MDKYLKSMGAELAKSMGAELTKSIGVELTEEQVEQLTKASTQAGVDPEAFAEAVVRVVTAFTEAWQTLWKIVRDMWDQIKEFINSLDTTTDTRPERKGWRVPRKIVRDHQVFDRRPRVAYARSEI